MTGANGSGDADRQRSGGPPRTRRAALATTACLTSGLLAGCGLQFPGTGTKTRGTGRITIEYVDVSGDRTAETFAPVVEELDRRYEPTVELSFSAIPYENMRSQLLTRLGGNDPPDVAAVDQIWLGSFIDSGQLLRLDEVAEEVAFDDYLPAFRDAVVEDGHVYGIPITTDVRGMYWNRDAFEAVGLDPGSPPGTWEELLDVAARLHDPPERYGAVYFVNSGRWTVSLFGAGGRVLDEAGTEPRFHRGPGVEAARFVDDLHNGRAVSPPEPRYRDGAQVAREFLTGQHAVTVVEGSWLDFFWRNLGNETEEMEATFGFAPSPSPDGTAATMSGGFSWVGFETTDHPDVVREFLRLVASREFKRHLAVETRSVPTRRSLLSEDAVWEGVLYEDTVRELLEATRPRPIRNWSTVASRLDPALQRVAFDRAEPEDALAAAADEVRSDLQQSG